MMFAIPSVPRKKYYVVCGEFGCLDWYLFDVANEPHATIRQWINDPRKALHFKSEEEAEQIGELVCAEDEFTISSFTKFP